MKGGYIFPAGDRHSDETVTLGKIVAEYEYSRKSMVEFLTNFESRVIKIDRVNSVHMSKCTNLLDFLYVPLPIVTSLEGLVFHLSSSVNILCSLIKTAGAAMNVVILIILYIYEHFSMLIYNIVKGYTVSRFTLVGISSTI